MPALSYPRCTHPFAHVPLSAARPRPADLAELLADPAVAVASGLLIAVSLAWILVARAVAGRSEPAELGRLERWRRSRDIWRYPPEPGRRDHSM